MCKNFHKLRYCQRIALVIYCWWTPERTNVFYLTCTIIIICRIKIFNHIYSTVKKLVNEPRSFATSLESNMILLHVCNCCFKVWGKFVMSSRLVDSSWPVYSFFEVYCTGVLLDAVLNSTWRKNTLICEMHLHVIIHEMHLIIRNMHLIIRNMHLIMKSWCIHWLVQSHESRIAWPKHKLEFSFSGGGSKPPAIMFIMLTGLVQVVSSL